MKQVLITGVAGFIGSHTALKLVKEGFEVFGVDNLNDYYSPLWKKENLSKLIDFPNFTFYKEDITDFDALSNIFLEHKIDTIIHLAARAGVRPSIADPLLYEHVNIRGTQIVLECVKTFKVPHLVFASSSSVYGNQKKTPFSETDSVDMPVSPYAATKKSGELLCYTYHHLYGISCTCLRFFTVYGPAGRPDMAPYLFTKAALENKPIKKFGDGTTRRDYTYIDDIVEGVVAAAKKPMGYEIINLGNNKPVSLNKFIETLEQILGKKIEIEEHPMQPGDVDQTFADISKAQKLLGYSPNIRFEDGLKKFVEWYKKNRL